MSSSLQPIADNLWTEGPEPQLLGGRDANGAIVFPIPDGEAGKSVDVVKLSRTGTLWSYTRQEFKPGPPYDGPEEFVPFLIGFIELPDEIIVQAMIVETTLEDLTLGMDMELVITAFDDQRSMYAFRPVEGK